MKRIVLAAVVLWLFQFIPLNAQNQNPDRFSSYRIGFFTKKMNLTPEEAEKFWPAYNEYQKQKLQIQKERIMLVRDFNQNASNLSDSQLTAMGDKIVRFMTDETALAVSFHKKLKEILPPVKVIRYYQAENQYKIQLLKELQESRQRRDYSGPEF